MEQVKHARQGIPPAILLAWEGGDPSAAAQGVCTSSITCDAAQCKMTEQQEVPTSTSGVGCKCSHTNRNVNRARRLEEETTREDANVEEGRQPKHANKCEKEGNRWKQATLPCSSDGRNGVNRQGRRGACVDSGFLQVVARAK